MTREEAIDYNKNLRMYMRLTDKNQPCKFLEENYIALDMAIKALEQEPCENAINREDALMALTGEWTLTEEWTELTDELIHRFIKRIKALPPVNPQPKIGHWIEERNDYGEVTGWHCDKCYEDSGFTTTCKWDFCPNCGAKMQGK